MYTKVSVIVPVYNVEKYLSRCLDSIVNQELDSIEILVVNDKSTDNSKEIILNYSKMYNNIIFIDKDVNEGVSAARNDALKIAKGKYIAFVDSDDWIERDMLSTLFWKAEKDNLDIVMCNHFVELDNGNNREKRTINLKEYSILNGVNATKEIMTAKNNMHGFIWNKLYKRDIIINNNIEFDSNLDYLEDLVFNIKLFLNCNKIKVLDKTLYHYIQREGSITKVFDDKYTESIDNIGKDIKNYLKYKNLNLELEYYNLMARTIIIGILNIIDSKNTNTNKAKMISSIFNNDDNKYCIVKCDKSYLRGYENKICKLLITSRFNSSLFLVMYNTLINIKKVIKK